MAKPKPTPNTNTITNTASSRAGNIVFNTTSNQLHMNTGLGNAIPIGTVSTGATVSTGSFNTLLGGTTTNTYYNYTISNGYIDYDIVEGYINEPYYDIIQFCISNISTDTIFSETLETLDILKERRFTNTSQFIGQTVDIVALYKHKHKESILKTDKTYLSNTLQHYKLVSTKEMLKEQIILDKILK